MVMKVYLLGKLGMLYPIDSMMGPAVPQLAGKKEVMEAVTKKANETLEKRIEYELSRVMQ